MTIICAIRDPKDDCSWIGSDTQWTTGDSERHFGRHKFIVKNNCALGINGAGAFLTLLANYAEEIDATWTAYAVWCWATKHFTETGAEPEEQPGSPAGWDCSFIWVKPDKLESICCTGGAPGAQAFQARGMGDKYAYGAAYSLIKHTDLSPREILVAAIKAAMRYSNSCGGEVYIHRLGADHAGS